MAIVATFMNVSSYNGRRGEPAIHQTILILETLIEMIF